ncbi:hypothetical protein BpHYR1_048693 [Brachionus plicatilis]|uniref:Uncharacterized protein n=1 Tax=Brachionus plicatilis TaxID=10195 RepID=A0A3M7S556_BRAPC|nr:hypothetical protein BpHYR1_048693 [Brachionus plicatilis]
MLHSFVKATRAFGHFGADTQTPLPLLRLIAHFLSSFLLAAFIITRVVVTVSRQSQPLARRRFYTLSESISWMLVVGTVVRRSTVTTFDFVRKAWTQIGNI